MPITHPVVPELLVVATIEQRNHPLSKAVIAAVTPALALLDVPATPLKWNHASLFAL
jgi:hypothetical protein